MLSAFTTDRPCDRKGNHPPGPEALAAAALLLGGDGHEPVVDLTVYEQIAGGTS